MSKTQSDSDVALPLPIGSQVDAGGILVVDLPCRRCGYNLRGLSLDGRCPECGTPVGLSAKGDLLRFSDPQWVETLARGVKLILWGILLLIIGLIGAGVVAALVTPLLGQVITFVAGLMSVYGAWLLTEPDPSGIGEDKYGTARKVIRVALIVGLAEGLLEMFPEIEQAELAMVMSTLIFLAAFFDLAGQVALLSYLTKLALRIPNLKEASRARFLMFAYPISLGIVIAGGIGFRFLVLPEPLLATAVGIGSLAALVFSIMMLLMLSRLGREFREQAGYARASWAASASPTTPSMNAMP